MRALHTYAAAIQLQLLRIYPYNGNDYLRVHNGHAEAYLPMGYISVCNCICSYVHTKRIYRTTGYVHVLYVPTSLQIVL